MPAKARKTSASAHLADSTVKAVSARARRAREGQARSRMISAPAVSTDTASTSAAIQSRWTSRSASEPGRISLIRSDSPSPVSLRIVLTWWMTS